MVSIRLYVLSIITASFLCGIITSLTEQNYAKNGIRLICGYFLLITVCTPIKEYKFDSILQIPLFEFADADAIVSIGKKKAFEDISEIIINTTEAYILEKTALLNTDITVTITLDANLIPEKAYLYGSITPGAKLKLESILDSDLGITKENQQWTG